MANDLVVTFKGNTTDALNKTNGLKSALGGFGSFATGALKTATVAAGALALGVGAVSVPIVKMGIDFNAMKETALTSFTVLLGSGDKANAMMQDLIKFAAATPFEFEEIAKSARSLLTANVGPEAMQETLTRVGDIAAGLNIPFSELSDLYAKILNQGRLYGEDINQLQGRGIPIIQELGKMYGKNANEIKKMVEEGKIGAPQIEEAFKNMTKEGGMFHDMMKQQSVTFSGMLSSVQDGFGQLAGKLAEPIFDLAKEGLSGLLTALDSPAVKEGIDNISKGIAGIIQSGKDLVADIQSGDIDGAMEKIAAGILKVAGLPDSAANKMAWSLVDGFYQAKTGIENFWKGAQPTLEEFKAWLEHDGVDALDTFFKKADEFKRVNGEWQDLLREMGTTFKLVTGGMKSDAETEFPSIAEIISTQLDKMNATTSSQASVLRGIFRTANAAIRGDWEQVFRVELPNALQDSFDEMLRSVGMNGEQMRFLFTQWLEKTVAEIRNAKDQFFGAAGELMGSLIGGLWADAQMVQAALHDIIQQAIDAILAGFGIGGNASELFLGGGSEGNFATQTTAGTFGGGGLGNVTIIFNGVSAPTNAAEAQQSGELIVNALRQKGYAV